MYDVGTWKCVSGFLGTYFWSLVSTPRHSGAVYVLMLFVDVERKLAKLG